MRRLLVLALVLMLTLVPVVEARKAHHRHRQAPVQDLSFKPLQAPPGLTTTLLGLVAGPLRALGGTGMVGSTWVENQSMDPQALVADLRSNASFDWMNIYVNASGLRMNLNQPARSADSPTDGAFPVFRPGWPVRDDDKLYLCGPQPNVRVTITDGSIPSTLFDAWVGLIEPCPS